MPLYGDLRDVNRASAICGYAKNKADIRPDATHMPGLSQGIGVQFPVEQTAASCLVGAVHICPPEYSGRSQECVALYLHSPTHFRDTVVLSGTQCSQLYACGAPVFRFESRLEQ